VGAADALATGFQLVAALLAGVVLVRPSWLGSPAAAAPGPVPASGHSRSVAAGGRRPLGVLLSGGALVAVASTLALSPALASDDHHHGGADEATGDHDHATMAPGETMDHHGGVQAAGAEGHTANVIQADGSSACEEAGVANEGNSGHGHRGPVPFTPLDDRQRDGYQAQVAESNAVVARLATVADAEAAGYRRVSPYVPCIAAHYIKTSALMGNGFDPAEPEVVLFAGTEPDSPVVGLSYLARADEAPDGFAGSNDPWHKHEKLCIGEGGVLGIETATEEGCAARGGRMVEVGNIWMTHMWNVPGWESRWGLFSSEHPDLGGRMGDIDATPDPDADDAWFDVEEPSDETAAGAG
jgi:hypothetical protein